MDVTLETPHTQQPTQYTVAVIFLRKINPEKGFMSVIKYQSSKDVTFEHCFHEMKDRDHVQFRDTF